MSGETAAKPTFRTVSGADLRRAGASALRVVL
jgi:hypothetical protein